MAEEGLSSSGKIEMYISLVSNVKVCKGEEGSSGTYGKFNFSYFVVPNSPKEGEGE